MSKQKSIIPDIGALLKKLGDTAKVAAEASIKKIAERERDGIKKRLYEQGFHGWVSLKRRTLARRKRAGIASVKTLIATGEYLESIKVYPRKEKNSALSFYVGVHASKMARDPFTKKLTSIPMRKIAAYNEYGSSALHIPARPHWQPYFVEMVTQRADKMAKEIQDDIVKAWTK